MPYETSIQPDSPLTQRAYHSQIVTNKQYRSPFETRNVIHFPEAFFLELGVADSKYLIDNKDLRLQMRGDREGKADIHPRRVAFDRGVQKFFHLGKVHYFVEFTRDLAPRHAEDRAVEINVLAAGELGMKARSDLQQAADPSL
jgi:hypothetical protein